MKKYIETRQKFIVEFMKRMSSQVNEVAKECEELFRGEPIQKIDQCFVHGSVLIQLGAEILASKAVWGHGDASHVATAICNMAAAFHTGAQAGAQSAVGGLNNLMMFGKEAKRDEDAN